MATITTIDGQDEAITQHPTQYGSISDSSSAHLSLSNVKSRRKKHTNQNSEREYKLPRKAGHQDFGELTNQHHYLEKKLELINQYFGIQRPYAITPEPLTDYQYHKRLSKHQLVYPTSTKKFITALLNWAIYMPLILKARERFAIALVTTTVAAMASFLLVALSIALCLYIMLPPQAIVAISLIMLTLQITPFTLLGLWIGGDITNGLMQADRNTPSHEFALKVLIFKHPLKNDFALNTDPVLGRLFKLIDKGLIKLFNFFDRHFKTPSSSPSIEMIELEGGVSLQYYAEVARELQAEARNKRKKRQERRLEKCSISERRSVLEWPPLFLRESTVAKLIICESERRYPSQLEINRYLRNLTPRTKHNYEARAKQKQKTAENKNFRNKR